MMIEIRPKLSSDGTLHWHLYDPLSGRFVIIRSRGEVVDQSSGKSGPMLDFLVSALCAACSADKEAGLLDQTKIKRAVLDTGDRH